MVKKFNGVDGEALAKVTRMATDKGYALHDGLLEILIKDSPKLRNEINIALKQFGNVIVSGSVGFAPSLTMSLYGDSFSNISIREDKGVEIGLISSPKKGVVGCIVASVDAGGKFEISRPAVEDFKKALGRYSKTLLEAVKMVETYHD